MKTLVLHTHALNVAYLGCYGNEWVATPNIDRLASEGIVFDQHYAETPSAKAGGASLKDHFHVVRGDFKAVQKKLRDVRREESWLVWAELPSLAPPWKVPNDDLELYFQEEAEDAPQPWLDPPVGLLENPDDLERLQDTYGAVVTHFDSQIGALRETFEETWNEIIVILTASSGFALGEHGAIGPHRAWMHEEVWHLPLIIRLPRAEEAGRRVSVITQPSDLINWLTSESERGIGACIRGDRIVLREFACGKQQIASSEEWALRTAEWSFLLPVEVPAGDPPRAPQLYVKPDDRWEVNDVSQHHPELVESFSERLHSAGAKPQAGS